MSFESKRPNLVTTHDRGPGSFKCSSEGVPWVHGCFGSTTARTQSLSDRKRGTGGRGGSGRAVDVDKGWR
jgi:hypothetical protein